MARGRHSRRTFLAATAGGATALAVGGSFLRLVAGADNAEGWRSLFDGQSLKGWHKNPQRIGHGDGGIWAVEDGAITGEQDPPGSGNGGILLTDEKFGDFELEIALKPDWGVCSGLFLRGTDGGACVQMMVDYHDRGNVGHLYGEGTGGFNTRTFDIDGVYGDARELLALKAVNERSAADAGLVASCTGGQWIEAWKVGDWNVAKVRVEGEFPRVTTWINGLMVCEFDGAASAAGGYDKDKVRETLGAEGSIAVQVHGGQGWPKGAKCRWKDIRVRTL